MSQSLPGPQYQYPYGTDLACVLQADGSIDLDPGMGECSGPTLLVQRVIRRITTPRGSVVDCPNDCIDIRNYLRSGVLASTPTNLQIQLQQELAKEPGLTAVAVGVKYVIQTATLTITINATTSYGPLALIINLVGNGATTTIANINAILNSLPVGF